MSAQTKPTHLPGLTTVLKDVMDKRFAQANITYSKDPEIAEREIIEYDSRMRATGMEKFNGPCFLSFVNFFVSENHAKENDAIGALIIYLESQNAIKALKAFGYAMKLDVEDEIVIGHCGEFTQSIADKLKAELGSRGYASLVISKPQTFLNSAPDGVPFAYNEYKSSEINFFAWKEKILSVELTMAPA